MIDLDYPFTIRQLSEDDGGGYLIEFPDLPGCMSDGDSIIEAIENGQDALNAWLQAAKLSGRQVPIPNHLSHVSGKWLQRVPKGLHAQLIQQAKQEGVSLNTLVVSMLSAASSLK